MKTMACTAIVAAALNTCSGLGESAWDDTPSTPNYDNSPMSPGTKTVKTYKYTVPGIPAEQYATSEEVPAISGNTVDIPTFTPTSQMAEGHEVINLTLPGIKDVDGNYIQLYGTFTNEQNIWMDIDGTPRSISLYNVFDGTPTYQENKCECSFIPEFPEIEPTPDPEPDPEPEPTPKPQVDIVFLVDNSESMGQEADAIAEQLSDWAKKLAQRLDVKFGCVGYTGEAFAIRDGEHGPILSVDNNGRITGAIDVTTVEKLSTFLNEGTGTERTEHFDAGLSEDVAYNSVGECGVAALRYALDKFQNFRKGASKIFINVTDEPNQYAEGQKDLNSSAWVKANKDKVGTIYTIFSGPIDSGKSSLNSSDYSGVYDTWVNWTDKYEHPEILSELTGGKTQYAAYDWKDGNLDNVEVMDEEETTEPTTPPAEVNLDDADVTQALENMHVISFVNEPDLYDGQEHEITIYIMTKDGRSYGTRTYKITFEK